MTFSNFTSPPTAGQFADVVSKKKTVRIPLGPSSYRQFYDDGTSEVINRNALTGFSLKAPKPQTFRDTLRNISNAALFLPRLGAKALIEGGPTLQALVGSTHMRSPEELRQDRERLDDPSFYRQGEEDKRWWMPKKDPTGVGMKESQYQASWLKVPLAVRLEMYRWYMKFKKEGDNAARARVRAYKKVQDKIPDYVDRTLGTAAEAPLAFMGSLIKAPQVAAMMGQKYIPKIAPQFAKAGKGAKVGAKSAEGVMPSKGSPSKPVTESTPPPGFDPFVGKMTDLDPVGNYMEEAVKGAGNRWLRLPGILQINKVFNPSAVAEGGGLFGIVQKRLSEQAANKSIGAYSALAQLGKSKQVFNINELGFIQKGKGIPTKLEGNHIDDVLERSKVLEKDGGFEGILTDSQKQWAEMYHHLNAEKLALLRRAGIEVTELHFDQGGKYVGRRVLGKVDETGELIYGELDLSGKQGGGMGQIKHRVFDSITQAQDEGYRYMTPEDALNFNIHGAYRAVAHQKILEFALKGMSHRSRDIEQYVNLWQLAKKALDGKPLVGRDITKLNTVARHLPEDVDNLKAMLKESNPEVRHEQLRQFVEKVRKIPGAIDAATAYAAIKGVGRVVNEAKIAQMAINVIQRALRGESIPTGTIKSIEKVFPQLHAGGLKDIMKITLDDLKRAGKKAAGLPKTLDDPKPYTVKNLRKKLADAETALTFAPKDKKLLATVAELTKKLNFAKYHWKEFKAGRSVVIDPSPAGILTKRHKEALQNALESLRGKPVVGKPNKFTGGELDKLKLQALKAEKALSRMKERVTRPSFTEGSHSLLRGKIFTNQKDIKALNDILLSERGDTLTKVVRRLNLISSVGRVMMLTADVSTLLIQLIIVPFLSPKAFAKAVGGGVKAMLNPLSHEAMLANNSRTVQGFKNVILSKQGIEGTEAFGRGQLLSPEGPWKKHFLGKTIGKSLQPFKRFYEASLDTAAIELKKGLEHIPKNAQEMLQLDQFINVVRGLTSSTRLGVAPSIQAAEALFFLAPRYNRAIAALMTDILRGGLRGKMARKAIMRATAGFAMIGTSITLAKGEGWEGVGRHLDIRSPDFMMWEFAGQKLGIGSKMRSVLALTGKMAHEPEKTVDHVLRWTRGNLSPLMGTAVDVVKGKDFLGNPTAPWTQGVEPGEGMLALTKTILAENLMFLWLNTAVFDEGTLGQRATRGTAEFLGMRAYEPSSVSSSYRFRWRDDLDEYNEIPVSRVERAKEGAEVSRDQYRKENPEIDAKLLIAGEVSSLKSRKAIGEVLRLIKENEIDPSKIRGIAEAREKIRELEEAELDVTPTAMTDLLQALASLYRFDDLTDFERKAMREAIGRKLGGGAAPSSGQSPFKKPFKSSFYE